MNTDDSFINKLQKLSICKRIPISDLLHLFKGARSHLLANLICIDHKTLKCIDVQLFQKVTELSDALTDKSNIAAMKDSYPLKIFSWEIFIKLLNNQCYDSCFYILPFLYMATAVRSNTLNKFDRIRFLELSIKVFYFRLNNMVKKDQDFFTQRYSSSSIGTFIGDSIFVKRCINTCIAICVALYNNEELHLARIGAHDVEAFFRMIRNLSYNNDTFDNAVNAAVKSIVVNILCEKLNFQKF